jgi:hypothetical protein
MLQSGLENSPMVSLTIKMMQEDRPDQKWLQHLLWGQKHQVGLGVWFH